MILTRRSPAPASFSPERTVVTTGLSKNLALGGWRLGVVRLPDGWLGHELRTRLLGIGSEIWSAPAGPVQQAAALAFTEPSALVERVALSRRLHAPWPARSRREFAATGASVPAPQAAFYLYPDFTPMADVLLQRHDVTATRAWRRCCCTGTGSGCCPAARSATRAGGCGCGSPPRCSTATPTPSGSPR